MKKEKSLKLKPFKFALSASITISAIVFLATILSILTNYTPTLISNIYGNIGYTSSITGAFLGAIYASIDAFILAIIFAWIYNKLSK